MDSKKQHSDQIKRINNFLLFLKESNFLQYLANLKGRWSDEKEYEDFADYEKVVQKKLSLFEGVSDVSMNKTFAVVLLLNGRKIKFSIPRGRFKMTYCTILGDFEY